MVFWVESHLCVRGHLCAWWYRRVLVHAHIVCNGISIMVYVINIITRPINLSNGSDPLIGGVETSIFMAIKHTFW